MSNPTPAQYEAQHRVVALMAAAQVYSGSEVNPHTLLTHAAHLCCYLDDGTVPPSTSWL
jgi:hypothetical protein